MPRRVILNGPKALQHYVDSMMCDQATRTAIRGMYDVLRSKPHAGEHVSRDLWPDRYVKQGISNLFLYKIGGQLRFPYTVAALDKETVLVKILDFFLTHKEYERVFGYS